MADYDWRRIFDAISRVPGHFGLLWTARLQHFTRYFTCSGTFWLALDIFAAAFYTPLFHVFQDILDSSEQLRGSILNDISRTLSLIHI